MGGWLLSGLASYVLGRLFAGPLLRSLLGFLVAAHRVQRRGRA
jgi:hypothetical protein